MSKEYDYEYCCECPNVLHFRERYFTNYLSSVYVNRELMKKYNITDSTSFRVFLQNNAELITKLGIHPIFNTNKCVDKFKDTSSLYSENYNISNQNDLPSQLYYNIKDNTGLSKNFYPFK
jgi:hypothetical protein